MKVALRALAVILVGALLMSGAPGQAQPDRRTDTSAPGVVATNPSMCAAGDPCYSTVQARINAFNNGSLRNSGGWLLPQNVRDLAARSARVAVKTGRLPDGTKLNPKMVRSLMRRDGEWWRYPLSSMMCMTWQTGRFCNSGSIPDQDRQAAAQVMQRTSKVAIVCGGSALIGYLNGGGAWGAGKGGGACLWVTVMSLWYDW